MNFCVVAIYKLCVPVVLAWFLTDYLLSVHGDASSTCTAVKFTAEGQIKQIGKWKNGCPRNEYITAVWSMLPEELFYDGKCCGAGDVLGEFSWEIRDIQVIVGAATGKTVNIVCPLYSVITGFRFTCDHDNTKILSAVRCSLLKQKVFNESRCTMLEFKKGFTRKNETTKRTPRVSETWLQECQSGYGLVGLIVEKSHARQSTTVKLVEKVSKGKCCHIYDNKLQPGWRSNFADNFAGFAQYKYSNYDSNYDQFEYNSHGKYIELNNAGSESRGALISPLVEPSKDMCIEISMSQNGTNASITIYLQGENKDHELRKMIPTTDVRMHKRYIRYVERFQIRLEAFTPASTNYLRIFSISLMSQDACNYDTCKPENKEDCGAHEMCIKSTTYYRCSCSRDYITNPDGDCVKRTGTDPKGKSGSPTTAHPQTLTPTPTIPKRKVKEKNGSDLIVFSIAGSAVGVILVVIGLTGCLCYRNSISGKHRRMNSFEQEMSIVDRTNQLLSVTSSSKLGNRSIYRPYMMNLGCVEHLSVNDVTGTPSYDVLPPRYCIDSSTGEPVYTQINKTPKVTESIHAEVFSNNYIESEPEEVGVAEATAAAPTTSARRSSCMTLLQPDYGESDSDDADESPAGHFFIPGDDEEELIGELNEISPDVIKITPRVIGQGAFGVVKHGTLHSVKGSQDVAIKMLKQRSGLELSKDDRVKFYQEAVIVSQFDHINVVALFGIMVAMQPCMVLEYMSRGNLSKYLNKVRRIRQREGVESVSREMQCAFLKMARDIVDGMCYLASFKFVHRDLAARNILLAENEGDLICKISDFGLSRHFIKDEEYYTSHGGHIPVKWTAPEALMFKKYSTQSDVWSYGICLWEIWSFGQQPYENWSHEKVLKEVCDKAYRLPAPDAVPSLLYHLMVDCWHPDKSQRPTFPKLRFCLSHSDERILGKGSSKRSERSRSNTFSSEDGESPLNNTRVSESQNTY